MKCPDCDAAPGKRCDPFCALAICNGAHAINWLECARENGKKHKPAIYVPTEEGTEPLITDFSGIPACDKCSAQKPRRLTTGWLVCSHQIDRARGEDE